MNYTKNYRLPQWVKEERIMMDDFNAMNTSIESGMTKTAATANAARADASEAKQTANAAAAARPYVVGSYTGKSEPQDINLGFKPAFVIVSGMRSTVTSNITTDFDRYFAMTAGNLMKSRIKITDTGFTVYPFEPSIYGAYPNLNESGRGYDYIAFK